MSQEQYQEWMQSLKAGDQFAYPESGGWSIYPRFSLHTVERTTPTLIITRQWKFRRGDGRKVGGSTLAFIRPVTQEILGEFQQVDLRRDILNDLEKARKLTDPAIALPVLKAMHAAKQRTMNPPAPDDLRAEFEAAYVTRFPISASVKGPMFNLDSEGEYLNGTVFIAFEMWKVGRA